MVETYDPMRSLTEPFEDYFVQHRDTPFNVTVLEEFTDKPVTITLEGRWLVYNLIFWRPLLSRGFPIRLGRHVFHNELFNSGLIERIQTHVLWDVILSRPDDVPALKFELNNTLENLYNFIITKNNEYVYTADLYEIAQTLTTRKAQALMHLDVSKEMDQGIKSVEAAYKARYKELQDFFMDPANQPNVYYPALILGTLNSTQFSQLVGGVGPRTDTDDSLIRLPIQNSFIKGMEDIRAYQIESLAAKKSVHYNAEEMPNAQYTNRKQQLNSSAICRIYPGDCGTDVTVKFRIHKNFASNCFGKYVKHEGRIVAITKDNQHLFWDRDVDMYSVDTCRYTNGFCHKCGGMLAQYFLPATLIPGIISGAEVMSPLSQQVLSNKHMATTFATTYLIPKELKDILVCQDNNISLTKEWMDPTLKLTFMYDDVRKLSDLMYVRGEVRDDKQFSEIHKVWMIKGSTGEIAMCEEMEDKHKTIPFLSAEVLEFIRAHPEKLETRFVEGDTCLVELSLDGFDFYQPIFRTVVVNYSTRMFVSIIQRLFASDIVKFTSITEYLETLSNAIWTRISPNILHLEIMGKASLITDETNFAIPVVTDPNHVKFGRLDQIIPRRSIGTQFAFEQFFMYISNPGTYLSPKESGPFDVNLGFSD